jgi:ribonuclease HI
MQSEKITIYTDGAARGNPGRAGWGAVIFHEGKRFEIGGRSDHATNNIMELTAGVKALEYLRDNKFQAPLIEVFSDSKYVINGITNWIFNWQKNNWKTAANKPVLNKELWIELHELNQSIGPKWIYVEGHNGHEWNERADEIATSFADESPINLSGN